MRIFLEISNESYRHSVDAHLPVATHPILRLCLRNGCELQNVEDIGKRAARIREIRENFVLVHIELLVR